MSIFDKIYPPRQKSESYKKKSFGSVNSIFTRSFGGKKASFFDLNDYEVISNGYNTNPFVYSAVNKLAGLASNVPLKVVSVVDKNKTYKQKTLKQRLLAKEQGYEDAYESDLYGLLSHPNGQDGMGEFWKAFYINKLVTGNGYIEAIRPTENRPPTELWVLPPLAVTLNESSDFYDKISEVYFGWGVTSKTIDKENFLHSKYYNPEGKVYGLSPLSAARKAVTMINDGDAHNVALLQNGAKPEYMLVVAEGTPPDQRENLREDWKKRYGGPYNAGEVIVTDEDFMKLEQLGFTMKDMDYQQANLSSMRKVYDVYGINSEVFNDPGTKTMANKKEAVRSLYVDRVIPEVDSICDELNRWLAPMYGEDLKVIADLAAVDALAEEQDKLVDRAAKAWWWTVDERRTATGKEAKETPESQQLYIPSNLVPLGGYEDILQEELKHTYGLPNGLAEN